MTVLAIELSFREYQVAKHILEFIYSLSFLWENRKLTLVPRFQYLSRVNNIVTFPTLNLVFMNPTSVEVSAEIARFFSFFFSSLDMIFGLVLMLLICFWISFYHVAGIFCVVVILNCTIAILKSGMEIQPQKNTVFKQC